MVHVLWIIIDSPWMNKRELGQGKIVFIYHRKASIWQNKNPCLEAACFKKKKKKRTENPLKYIYHSNVCIMYLQSKLNFDWSVIEFRLNYILLSVVMLSAIIIIIVVNFRLLTL